MSKCHVTELNAVYAAILEDAAHRFPTLVGDFEKDRAHLVSASTTRGIHVFVVDLPKAGKHLDRCLAAGLYKPSGLPLTQRVSDRVVIPKLFRGLYLQIFEANGRLKENVDADSIFFLRQLLYVAKKTDLPCSEAKLVDAVREFFATDCELPVPDSVWNNAASTPEDFKRIYTGFTECSEVRNRVGKEELSSQHLFLRNMDIVSNILTTTLGHYDWRDWDFKHGPGAISEVTGKTNKYAWRSWSENLESAYPIADCGFHSYSSWASGCMSETEFIPASRLIAVPKTFSTPRLIAAEPASHQWCQQNILAYFYGRSSKTWIGQFVRFSDQTLNQELCVEGSKDSSLMTVDLSSASDRVTCHVVGNFFRSNPMLLKSLSACRTPRITQSLVRTMPEVYELRKFSTMGSACTFPVQSLIFLGIAIAATLTQRGEVATTSKVKGLIGSVTVFGDDIVVPTVAREILFDGLEALCFKINTDKSFWNGNFRESCGVDAFMGVNVTPVYWRRPNNNKPDSLSSTLDTRNNFYRKFLISTASYLESTIHRPLVCVPMTSGVVGLQVFVSKAFLLSKFKTRWNAALQRFELLVTSTKTSGGRRATNDDTSVFQFFIEHPSPLIHWEHGVAEVPLTKMRKRWEPIHDYCDLQ